MNEDIPISLSPQNLKVIYTTLMTSNNKYQARMIWEQLEQDEKKYVDLARYHSEYSGGGHI